MYHACYKFLQNLTCLLRFYNKLHFCLNNKLYINACFNNLLIIELYCYIWEYYYELSKPRGIN